MVSTELGACEWFVWDLRRSNLLDHAQLDPVIGEFLQKNPRAEPPALAEYLVGQGILTPFQAERLLQGKTQGFVLGPFTLMDSLGAGSMGTVYKALSKTDNQWYAVKVLPRRSMWNVRIARRKVRSFEQARHPSVVPFVDVGTAGGMHFLAWPYVEGELLDKIVAERGKLNSGLAANYAIQIAEGLDVCQQQGLIHGLLKPSNLMVNADQEVKILDFGIGCLLAETEGESLVDTMSTSNSVTSGLDCASPESIMDPTNLTPAGDQYSLGCILYFMVTGQCPFPEGSAAEKMMAHQFKQPTPVSELNPEAPAELVGVIEKLMQKSPDKRYASTAEVIEALRPLAVGASFLQKKPGRAAPLLGKPLSVAPDGLRGLGVGGSASGLKPAGSNPGTRPPGSQPGVKPAGSHPGTKSASGLSNHGASPAGRLSNSGAKPASSLSNPGTKPAGSLSNPGTRQVSPVTPTPRPQSFGSLPTRSSIRGKPVEPDPSQHEVPGSYDPDDELSWEERLGPMGVVITALATCAIVYFTAVWLKIL